jgi:beta-lactamase regulating signal transducer with metallopeptidase domain
MLWWLAQNLVVAALLAAVVAILCRLAHPGPALRHALWLLVLIKLLTPPVVSWPWQLPDSSHFLSPEAGPARDLPLAPMNEPLAGELADVLAFQADAEPAAGVGGVASASTSESGRHAWLPRLALGLWFSGTALVATLHLLRIGRFRGLLKRAQWPPRWLKQHVRELAGRLQVRRPRTQVVPQIDSPAVWSLGRPRLLWPEALLDTLPAGCRRSVVAHELAHLRRRDHWVGWLILVAECLWWWNPLYWYVRRQLRVNAELACDAWVVHTLPEDRRAYAEALLEVTQSVSRTAAPVPALGMRTGARHLFERRLTMIMREPASCRVSVAGLVGLAVLAFLVLPGWSLVQTARADDPKAKPDQPSRADSEDRVILFKWLDSQTDGQPQVGRVAASDDVVFVFKQLDKTGGQTDKGSDADRERRLRALEQQIESLLKEVQALRKGDKGEAQHQVRVIHKDALLKDAVDPGDKDKHRVRIITQDDLLKANPEGRKDIQVHVIENKDGVLQLHVVPKDEKIFEFKSAEPKAKEDIRYRIVRPGKLDYPDTKQEKLLLHVEQPLHLKVDTEKLQKSAEPKRVYGFVTSVLERNEPIVLVRATYRLPPGKAKELASLLGQLVKAPVLETKVDGDVLTVTTTPDSQKAIGALIGLIEGKSSGSKEHLQGAALELDARVEPLMFHYDKLIKVPDQKVEKLIKITEPKVNAIELKFQETPKK